MQEIKKEKENDITQEAPKKEKWNFRQIFNGRVFLQDSVKKQTLYILFLVFLSIIYIYNKYRNEALLVGIIKTQKELRELRDRSVIYASELMSLSRESEVIKMVDIQELGLKELKSPPEIIKVKKQAKDGS
jgi:hypothetical protein